MQNILKLEIIHADELEISMILNEHVTKTITFKNVDEMREFAIELQNKIGNIFYREI